MSWNGSDGSANVPKKPTAKAPSKMRGLVALAVVVVIGGTAAWFLMRQPVKPASKPAELRPKRIGDVGPHLRTNHTVAVAVPAVTNSEPKKFEGTIIKARTASEGDVVTLMDGTVVTNRPPKPIFKRDLERALQVALRPGGMSRALIDVLLRRHSEAEIEAMLREMTIPEPDDPENIKNIKNGVQSLKEKILLELQSGRTVGDVFDEIKRTGIQENCVRVQTMKLRAEAIRGGDAEDVRTTVKAVNKIRAESGLEPLSVPDAFKAPEQEGDVEQPVSGSEANE